MYWGWLKTGLTSLPLLEIMGISWGYKPTNMMMPCFINLSGLHLPKPKPLKPFLAKNYGHWGPTHGILIVKYVKTPNFLGGGLSLGFSH
jgi:hypothetical protein